MKAATVNELKEELKHRKPAELLELCSRLARFKKENKELLTYLLFEEHDERAYITSVKDDMDAAFNAVPKDNNLYLIKKSYRKILRSTNKYIRYTGSKIAEVELLLHYCTNVKDSGVAITKSTALTNLYNQQLKKTGKTVKSLHEDLQYDYERQLKGLAL